MPTQSQAEKIKENETELQPDPLLKEGPASKTWTWIVGLAAVIVVGVYFYAVGQ